jgi:hypothetical protein
MNPTVAPEHFCDHEVIMKALISACIRVRAHAHGFFELSRSTLCGLVWLMWYVVVELHQDALMM